MSEIANTLFVAPSTATYQVGVMIGAGLLSRTQRQSTVIVRRTPRGDALLRLYRDLGNLLRPGGLVLNGDHMAFSTASPTFARLGERVLDEQWTDAAFAARGIETAEQAWEMLRAGATLLQVYTAMVYAGPALAAQINAGLARRLADAGATSVADVVGSDSRAPADARTTGQGTHEAQAPA